MNFYIPSKKKNKFLLALVFLNLFLITSSAWSHSAPLSADIGFVSVPHYPAGGALVNPIRYAAIQETASTLGAQGGLAWQSKILNNAVNSESVFLDQAFDFNQLLLDHNTLPPVLVESNNNLNLADNETLRIATKTYRIQQQARFVTTPPNWRDYLWMHFKKPEVPDSSLLPQTKEEAQVWNHFLQVGWENGVNQANAIFTTNLNCLERDMIGMILYRKLLAQKMVSAPFVAKAQLGITGDATQLRINDQVLRITAQSQLQPNSKQWKPILTK